jgi:hypothetical protein
MLILDTRKKIRNSLPALCTVVPSLLFSFSSPAFAARPLTTDDAGTVEKGKFQVETGFDFTRQDNHDRGYDPSWTLAYGLSERVDLGL